ncbi:hypothetical protein AS156_00660 [Bradyrhizobium macuxiense]|uniref:Uncharacterized protein n=1 Tax=Bradyrhizobium macuxiense TaxID=1755647 RepID=A0A125Q8H9_9BRAD|nr:hypothetical protein AS156_00660 [Bradyrhizobium macuxiense]
MSLRCQLFAFGFARLRTFDRRQMDLFPLAVGRLDCSDTRGGEFSHMDKPRVFRHERMSVVACLRGKHGVDRQLAQYQWLMRAS